jgi:septal ring factor EnvC (AmiA/AmiB activator)
MNGVLKHLIRLESRLKELERGPPESSHDCFKLMLHESKQAQKKAEDRAFATEQVNAKLSGELRKEAQVRGGLEKEIEILKKQLADREKELDAVRRENNVAKRELESANSRYTEEADIRKRLRSSFRGAKQSLENDNPDEARQILEKAIEDLK